MCIFALHLGWTFVNLYMFNYKLSLGGGGVGLGVEWSVMLVVISDK